LVVKKKVGQAVRETTKRSGWKSGSEGIEIRSETHGARGKKPVKIVSNERKQRGGEDDQVFQQ